MEYCGECGYAIYGGMPVSSAVMDSDSEDQIRLGSEMAERAVPWILILTGMYAIFTLLNGLYLMLSADQVAGSIKDLLITGGYDWTRFLATLGLTEEGFARFIMCMGIVASSSGLLVAISAILSYIRRSWIVAVALCATGAVVPFTLLYVSPPALFVNLAVMMALVFTVGMMVTFLIYKSKDAFED